MVFSWKPIHVDLDTDAVTGVNVPLVIKLSYFFVILFVFYSVIEFYVRKPFLSTYCLTFVFVAIPLRLYSRNSNMYTRLDIGITLWGFVWLTISLWRLSGTRALLPNICYLYTVHYMVNSFVLVLSNIRWGLPCQFLFAQTERMGSREIERETVKSHDGMVFFHHIFPGHPVCSIH